MLRYRVAPDATVLEAGFSRETYEENPTGYTGQPQPKRSTVMISSDRRVYPNHVHGWGYPPRPALDRMGRRKTTICGDFGTGGPQDESIGTAAVDDQV